MNWLKKWLYRQVRQGETLTHRIEKEGYPVPTVASRMDQLFGNCSPAIVAFKIDNGYVMRSVEIADNYGPQAGTLSGTGFVYCKDHKEIADQIVSEAAKTKMGLTDHHANQTQGKQSASQYTGSLGKVIR